jgi:ATP-dependent Lon protease
MEEIGLFPLGIVMLPGERVPLHIFEERYKELIGECLEAGGEFGMVFADDDGVRAVGTTVEVVEVLERFDDGRLNIVVEGRRRFRVRRVTEGRSFITAEIDDLADERPDSPSPEETAACLDAYRRMVEAAGGEPSDVGAGAGSLAFEIAGSLAFSAPIKQQVLETLSERDRVLRLTEVLTEGVENVRLQRKARELAAGDGHVGSE